MLNAGQPTTDFVVLSRDGSDATKESVQTTNIGRIESGKSVKKTVYLCAEDLPGTRLVTLTVSCTLLLLAMGLTWNIYLGFIHVCQCT